MFRFFKYIDDDKHLRAANARTKYKIKIWHMRSHAYDTSMGKAKIGIALLF